MIIQIILQFLLRERWDRGIQLQTHPPMGKKREFKEGGAVQYSELNTLEEDPTDLDTWM